MRNRDAYMVALWLWNLKESSPTSAGSRRYSRALDEIREEIRCSAWRQHRCFYCGENHEWVSGTGVLARTTLHVADGQISVPACEDCLRVQRSVYLGEDSYSSLVTKKLDGVAYYSVGSVIHGAIDEGNGWAKTVCNRASTPLDPLAPKVVVDELTTGEVKNGQMRFIRSRETDLVALALESRRPCAHCDSKVRWDSLEYSTREYRTPGDDALQEVVDEALGTVPGWKQELLARFLSVAPPGSYPRIRINIENTAWAAHGEGDRDWESEDEPAEQES